MSAVFSGCTLRWKEKLSKRPLVSSFIINKRTGAYFLSKIAIFEKMNKKLRPSLSSPPAKSRMGIGNWRVFSSHGFILDFGVGADLPFHFKWRGREMNGNSDDLSPPPLPPPASLSYLSVNVSLSRAPVLSFAHHFQAPATFCYAGHVATFPIFIKFPVKGLRCHPEYQEMGLTF